jgi:two-component sensor histidine kinase
MLYYETYSSPIIPKEIFISIIKHFDDFEIEQNVVISLGIIVNELFTNILKYAFKNRNSGTVEISLKKAPGLSLSFK